jgi:hypothetical protein
MRFLAGAGLNSCALNLVIRGRRDGIPRRSGTQQLPEYG